MEQKNNYRTEQKQKQCRTEQKLNRTALLRMESSRIEPNVAKQKDRK